jgi:two-component system phosphate regulon sensor histidine kinase PhoR
LSLDRFIKLALALAGVALLGHWWLPAGLGLALGLAVLWWSREDRQAERLRLYVQRLDAGHYDAQLGEPRDGILEEAGLALETLGRSLGERFRVAEETRRRLMAALNGMREGVVLCDHEGAVLLMNPAFQRLTGFEEPIARRYFLWEAVRDPELNHAVEAALEGRRPRPVDLPLDAGRLDGRALVTPIDSAPGGQGGGAVVLLFDRTEEKRVERLRSEFVANVSHELRTPLAAIKASLETLADGAVDDPKVNRSFVEKAARHSERLEELLSDLLSLSQIEEQRRKGQAGVAVHCNVVEAWADAEALLEPGLRRHEAKVTAQWPAELPALAIERGSLRQILVNYVDNAAKHSGGAANIQVGAQSLDGEVEVFVRDQGQGIPVGDLGRVFERFFRVDKARTRSSSGGSGLGLAIVKHLAENAGAHVGVESELGKGSRFWVRVPVAKA